MRRFLGPAALFAVLSLLAAACSSDGMSTAQGDSVASNSRHAVAKVYWQVYNSLDNTVIRTDGFGRFVSCSGSGTASDSLRYGISGAMSALNAKQELTRFTGLVLSKFATAGWTLHSSGQNSSGQNVYTASKNGVDSTLRTFKTNLGPGASLTVEGGCVNAGSAGSAILSAYGGSGADRYRASETSASPIPTSLTPSS